MSPPSAFIMLRPRRLGSTTPTLPTGANEGRTGAAQRASIFGLEAGRDTDGDYCIRTSWHAIWFEDV